MIVCIHFKFFGAAGEFITVIARFAVPVFFMISGYYSYGAEEKKIRSKIFNILKLYLIALVLYFCFNIAVMLINGQYREAMWYVSTYLRIQYTAKTILFNESLTAIHLLFLGSLIYTYIIWYFIIKTKIKDNAVYVISCILLLVNIGVGIGLPLCGIETPDFLLQNYILRNFLFTGFPLFTFGHFMRKNEDAILKVMSGKLIVIFILVGVVDAVVVHKIDWTKDLYLGSLIMAFALFALALKLKNREYPKSAVALFGTATNIYLIHMALGNVFDMTIGDMQFYLYLKPVIIFTLTVVISLLVNHIMLKIKKQKR